MYELFDRFGLQQLTEQAVVFRVLLAILFGGALGLERTRKRRAAGFRTHILVCIGATMVMMTGQFAFQHLGGTDPSRLGAQVISGIGFLGAGTILVTGAHQIKGLTTAAGLWSAACMGIAIGIGFYFGAFVMCIALLVVMSLFDLVQERYVARTDYIRLYVMFETMQNITDFLDLCKSLQIRVEDFETMRTPSGSGISVLFNLRFKEKKSHSEIIDMIRGCKGLLSVEEF